MRGALLAALLLQYRLKHSPVLRSKTPWATYESCNGRRNQHTQEQQRKCTHSAVEGAQ